MRYITVPKNKKALEKLDVDEAQPDELYEITLSEKDMEYLFVNNFFIDANRILDVNIDAYEYEAITDMRKLIIFRDYIYDCMRNNNNLHELSLYSSLFELTEHAIECETGIFFFL